MERVNQRLVQAHKVLKSLEEVLSMEVNAIIRDAAIKRFEYSIEITWKLAQSYLRTRESLDVASPRRVIRSCFEIGFLNDAQTKQFLDMLNDRNLTTHTYDEEAAESIYSKLDGYYSSLKFLVDRIANELA